MNNLLDLRSIADLTQLLGMLKQILTRFTRSRYLRRDDDENGFAVDTHNTINCNGHMVNDTNNTDNSVLTHLVVIPTRTLSATVSSFIPNMMVKTAPIPVGEGVFNNITEPLPLLRDVPSSERLNLFFTKLSLCSTTFDFSNAMKNVKEKEIKRQTLAELADFISTTNFSFPEVIIVKIVNMFAANLFRTFPPSTRDYACGGSLETEEEEPALEPAWSHLQGVYEFFLCFIMSSEMDVRIARRYIDHDFILKFLDLFDSEDSRERESLKTVLHRLYQKFMVHRPFMRKAINNVLYRFIFETQRHNGIAELLEILGSIICGFALPLKEEHKLFLVRVLIPLHKVKSVSTYHQQLCVCVTQFVRKDFKLADTVIRGLLKYWPISNSQKEVLFLSELEEVLEVTQLVEFQRCMVPLLRQVGLCVNSMHFQVAERALLLWNNDHIIDLVSQNIAVILPIVFPALERNTRSHWNQAVHGLTLNARKMFLGMDQELFQECKRRFDEEVAQEDRLQDQRRLIWERLEALASMEGVLTDQWDY